MHSIISFTKDIFMNIRDIISESEIRHLKNSDEYSYRQFEEYLILKNSRNSFVFTVLQFILGVVILILTLGKDDLGGHGEFLIILGSLVILAAAVLFFFYYKSELSRRNHEYPKLKLIFWVFWGIYTIGALFVSSGFYISENSVFGFILFILCYAVVPVFKIYENSIWAFLYIVTAVYYGIADKQGAIFYISLVFGVVFLIWLSAFRYYSCFSHWQSRKALNESSERCTVISRTDTLTGLLNRTGLTAKFTEQYNSMGKGHKIAVIVADIDNFRMYNHKYGYDKSDACLYKICNCIRIIAKPVTDIVSRFGGDDFILILSDMNEIEVVSFAEQLRSAVETMAFPFGDDGIVTISIGVSGIVELDSEETYSRLLNEADIQLMIAKKGGKNCVGYRNHAFVAEKKSEKSE